MSMGYVFNDLHRFCAQFFASLLIKMIEEPIYPMEIIGENLHATREYSHIHALKGCRQGASWQPAVCRLAHDPLISEPLAIFIHLM